MVLAPGSTVTSRLAPVPRATSTPALVLGMGLGPFPSSLTQPFDVACKSLSSIQCPLVGHPKGFFIGAPSTWFNLFFLLKLPIYNGGQASTPMQSAFQRRKYIMNGLSPWLASTRGETWGSL